ncbi:hypothetical protein Tco_0133596 [Tanacetum coccineum]
MPREPSGRRLLSIASELPPVPEARLGWSVLQSLAGRGPLSLQQLLSVLAFSGVPAEHNIFLQSYTYIINIFRAHPTPEHYRASLDDATAGGSRETIACFILSTTSLALPFLNYLPACTFPGSSAV